MDQEADQNNNQIETVCPGCEKHCPAERPGCNWGKKHFGMKVEEEKAFVSWAERRRRLRAAKEKREVKENGTDS